MPLLATKCSTIRTISGTGGQSQLTSRDQSWVKLERNKSITNNACIKAAEKYYNVQLNTKTINAAKQRSVTAVYFRFNSSITKCLQAKPENSG